jgi:hypothetical protein
MFMTYRWTLALAVVGLTIGCTPASTPAHTPPEGSYTTTTHQMSVGDATFPVSGAAVTPEFFTGAGVQPLLGRSLAEADFRPDARPVLILTHGVWAERFASAPSVIGQQIAVDDVQTTVVGVMPQGFSFPEDTKIWMPSRDAAR